MGSFNSGLGLSSVTGLLVNSLGFFPVLVMNIIILVIAAAGYKEKKSRGWLLLMIYGFINIIVQISTIGFSFAQQFFSVGGFGEFMFITMMVSMMFGFGASIVFIIGLVFLLREYRMLVRNQVAQTE